MKVIPSIFRLFQLSSWWRPWWPKAWLNKEQEHNSSAFYCIKPFFYSYTYNSVAAGYGRNIFWRHPLYLIWYSLKKFPPLNWYSQWRPTSLILSNIVPSTYLILPNEFPSTYLILHYRDPFTHMILPNNVPSTYLILPNNFPCTYLILPNEFPSTYLLLPNEFLSTYLILPNNIPSTYLILPN